MTSAEHVNGDLELELVADGFSFPTSLTFDNTGIAYPVPERALLRFPPHAAAVKFDVAPAGLPGWTDQIVVALFGDEAPMTAPAGPRVGRAVACIDPSDWSLHQVIAGPLARPIDVRFAPHDKVLYILDFGHFEMSERGVVAEAGTGKLWRLPVGLGYRNA